MPASKIHIAFYSLLIFCTFACGTSQYVDQNRTLLDGNKIILKDKKNVKDKGQLQLELLTFYQQVPNNNFFWLFPREWFYFKKSSPGDTSWFDNWVRNSLGESPVFYNENITKETANSMEKFLRNNKGYYKADVDFDLHVKGHKTKVDYNILTGKRYTVNDITYISDDKNVLEILESMKDKSLLKPGDPLDDIVFGLEKTRMVTELQNRGYANFVPNYIDIKGDSTGLEYQWDVFFQIYPPLPDTTHRQYAVGKINVYTDYNTDQDISQLNAVRSEEINFYHGSKDFIVKPSLLRSKIFINEGDILSRNDRIKTRRKLNDIGTYTYVEIKQRLDENIDSLINFDIFLTPHEKAWVADSGLEFNYSSVAAETQRQLFGIAVNGTLINRNFLGGAEQNSFSVDNGYELNLDSLSLSTFSLGISDNLAIPKHIDFLGTTRGLNRLGILSDSRYQSYREEAVTNLNLSYNISDLVDFYRINSINASISYNYQPNSTSRYVIKQTGFSLNSYKLEDRFLEQFSENRLLLNSFKDNLSTGFVFNEFSYFYNSIPRSSGFSYVFLGTFETSGLEAYALNQAYNGLAGSNKIWSFSEDISFAKYIKTEVDTRLYRKISDSQSFVFRINTGIAVPYAEQISVPFIKQFSVGGPSSMRAWDQKELGPGSFENIDTTAGQIFFQQGDIKLEFNAEYRFDIAWLLEGALFIDMGNVWTLEFDEQRPGSKFTSCFYKQLAIGAGWGARWDFTYFNLRFDFGYRIRNPFPDETGKYFYTWKEIKDQKFGNFQVAVNYPF